MRQVLITEQGLHLHGDGDSLIISRERIEISRIRLGEIESLSLFGRIELTSGAIAVLVRRGIPVVFLTERGQFRTRLWTRTGPDVALRLGQLEIARDPDRAILLARAMIRAKVEHQRRILLRAQRGWKLETVANSLTRMRPGRLAWNGRRGGGTLFSPFPSPVAKTRNGVSWPIQAATTRPSQCLPLLWVCGFGQYYRIRNFKARTRSLHRNVPRPKIQPPLSYARPPRGMEACG